MNSARWARSAPSPSTIHAIIGALFVVAASAVMVLAAMRTLERGFHRPWVAVAFGLAVASGEFVRVHLPSGRDAAPLGVAAASSYAMTPRWPDETSVASTWQVITVCTAAVLIGIGPHLAVGRGISVAVIGRRLVMLAVVAATVRVEAVADVVGGVGVRWLSSLVLLAVVAVALTLDAVIAAGLRSVGERVPIVRAVVDECRAMAGISAAVGATAVLIALAATSLRAWALPVFAVPLLLTQFAFRKFSAVRATYLQTIRSLARVTEVGGYTEPGHSTRVAQLAVAVGRELAMSEADVLDLEYAALMHDIGQLSLTDPIPGGATVVAARAEQRRIATLGAQIVRETGVLDSVVHIVAQQAEPYRQAHEIIDHSVPLGSRVIKAANAYDDLVGAEPTSSLTASALDRLRLGASYEYDPRVVEALTRVVGRLSRVR